MTYTPWTGTIKFPGSTQAETAAAAPAATTPNLQIIPLDNSPNQSFNCTLLIDGASRTLHFTLRYNVLAQYWTMGISDPETGEQIIDSMPLVTGLYPAGNLLGQFTHLGIGSAAIVPVSSLSIDFPNDTDLGSDFMLVWGDTL